MVTDQTVSKVSIFKLPVWLSAAVVPRKAVRVPLEGAAAQAMRARPREGALTPTWGTAPLAHGELCFFLWGSPLGRPAGPASHLPKVASLCPGHEGSGLGKRPRAPHTLH